MIYQNHVIDPTFFYDAIEEFSFNYTLHVLTNKSINSYGDETYSYMTTTIRGSLQSQGNHLVQSLEGNTHSYEYNFYCKSLYRIDIGDILEYKDRYLRVESVNDYDEYGVRSCSMKMIDLTAYKDFNEYIDYLNGVQLV